MASRSTLASGNDEIARPPYLNPGVGTSSQSQAPSGQPGGGLSSTQRGSTMGSVYAAFEDHEHKIRQRKYWIAECEDTLAGLKVAEAERANKRKELSSEAAKLEMGVKAAEATREKNRKEKALIDNKYQKLSSEMDNLSERAIARKTMIRKIEMFRQEKLQFAEAKTREYKIALMKVPAIANFYESRKRCEDSQILLKERNEKLQRRIQTFNALSDQFPGDWEVFKKKCIKMAETRREVCKKVQLAEELQADCKNRASKRTPVAPVGLVGRSDHGSQYSQSQSAIPPLSQRSLFQHQREPLSKKIGSFVIPRVKRPSSFQQMDRILKRQDTWQNYISKSHERSASSKNLMPPPSSISRKSGASLVSELRSRLRAPVRINPMPRFLERSKTSSAVAANSSQESSGNQVIPDSQESVVNQSAQNETSFILPPPQPIQTSGPTLESMDTNESVNVDASNAPQKEGEESNRDANGEKLPPNLGNETASNPLDTFSSFPRSKEPPSSSSGLFGMDFLRHSPQQSFLDNSNDFFGPSAAAAPTATTTKSADGPSTLNNPVSFFFV